MNKNISFDAIANLLGQLTGAEKKALVGKPSEVKAFLATLVAQDGESTFVISLSDKEVPERLQHLVQKYRKLAAEHGYSGPVAWRVKEGFTLKIHAPKAGPCYEKFEYLQEWTFEDEPTKNAIVFWVPRMLEGSTNKNADEQRALLTKTRKSLGLPEHHLSGFGSVALVAALTLAEFKRSGTRVPLNTNYVRTDTRRSVGLLLDLGSFGDVGLDCRDYWVDRRASILGVFALGVELKD